MPSTKIPAQPSPPILGPQQTPRPSTIPPLRPNLPPLIALPVRNDRFPHAKSLAAIAPRVEVEVEDALLLDDACFLDFFGGVGGCCVYAQEEGEYMVSLDFTKGYEGKKGGREREDESGGEVERQRGDLRRVGKPRPSTWMPALPSRIRKDM